MQGMPVVAHGHPAVDSHVADGRAAQPADKKRQEVGARVAGDREIAKIDGKKVGKGACGQIPGRVIALASVGNGSRSQFNPK
jgi:hypothetical protein